MTHMTKQERDEALSELAELHLTLNDLEATGLDVSGLRREATRARAVIESADRANVIEAWLRSMPEGQVIAYRVQFGNVTVDGAPVYHFAAVKIGLLWFTTARQGTGQFTSHDLAHWMANQVNLVGCVRLRVERGGDPHRSPDVEMGQS